MNRPNYKEVIEYIEMTGISVVEAYHAFCRMGRPPLTRTMRAVYRRVPESQWYLRRACALCNNPVAFVANTAIGERGFCSEKCYCEYVGLPYHGEGHYGLVKP